MTTCPYFKNLEFYIFVAGGPLCHFVMTVTIAVRIRTFPSTLALAKFSVLKSK